MWTVTVDRITTTGEERRTFTSNEFTMVHGAVREWIGEAGDELVRAVIPGYGTITARYGDRWVHTLWASAIEEVPDV